MQKKVGWFKQILFVLLLVLFLSISSLVTLYTDFLWFKNLSFESIFLIALKSKLSLFFASALVFFVFTTFNVWLATKLTSNKKVQKALIPFPLKLVITLLTSVVVGLFSYQAWFTLLSYLNASPFGILDPIFNQDVSFYVFILPWYHVLWRFVFACVFFALIFSALSYFESLLVQLYARRPVVPPNVTIENPSQPQFDIFGELSKIGTAAKNHLFILTSFLFVLAGVKNYLDKFSIMFSEQGIVVGAGYTDVHILLPTFKLLMVIALITAFFFLVHIFFVKKQSFLRRRHVLLYLVAVYIAFNIIGLMILPGLVQKLKVAPNELNVERPFLEHNIAFTRAGYGLEHVEEIPFTATSPVGEDGQYQFSPGEEKTLENIRILDWRPLKETYRQTQGIRLYYDLAGIDLDRYTINGEYKEVMLAPREMDQSQILDNAKTWVNEHLIYTHGYGVVMSPVNEVTKEGLPNYLIKDIPPKSDTDEENLKIDQPRIYYGEKDGNYVVVNTKTEEFDYPLGDTNAYFHYDGAGGVLMDSFVKKLLLTFRFQDLKILLSGDITKESRLMFYRNVQDRISKLTPFLVLDSDPYMVIADGRLVWIQDAYTYTENFPYSQKSGSINYLRNAVKIVVDAYEGSVTYYVVDESDPIMQTYMKIFPEEFQPLEKLPESIRDHIKYPEDLFKIQSKIYSIYHMDDPTVFYNKEDAWQIPHEVYGTGQKVTVEPYYIIMKLPGEEEEEFVLMTSFTPLRKDNMIAWLAARSDKNYGKLLLYKFPKDKLVYGPLQIEAKFDQDSEISQQLTLWSQQGSKVTRGNLLVLPLKSGLLYVEPLYIQAEKGQLPELKRILVSDGERVFMEPSLDLALEKLFGKKRSRTSSSSSTTADTTGTPLLFSTDAELITKASQEYDMILEAMQEHDWNKLGDYFDRLGETIGALEER